MLLLLRSVSNFLLISCRQSVRFNYDGVTKDFLNQSTNLTENYNFY